MRLLLPYTQSKPSLKASTECGGLGPSFAGEIGWKSVGIGNDNATKWLGNLISWWLGVVLGEVFVTMFIVTLSMVLWHIWGVPPPLKVDVSSLIINAFGVNLLSQNNRIPLYNNVTRFNTPLWFTMCDYDLTMHAKIVKGGYGSGSQVWATLRKVHTAKILFEYDILFGKQNRTSSGTHKQTEQFSLDSWPSQLARVFFSWVFLWSTIYGIRNQNMYHRVK
jgi:hypothetical protein